MHRLFGQSREAGYTGYREEDIIAAINSEAGIDLQPLLYRLVHNKDRVDYSSLLENTGLFVSASPQPDGSMSYLLTIRHDAAREQLRRLEELIAAR